MKTISCMAVLVVISLLTGCTKTLKPDLTTHNQSRYEWNRVFPFELNTISNGLPLEKDHLTVGRWSKGKSALIGSFGAGWYSRGLVRYDFSGLKKEGVNKILQAKLQFKMKDSFYQPDPTVASNEKRSCLSEVRVATEDWSNGLNHIAQSEAYRQLPTNLPSNSSYISPDKKVKMLDNTSFSVDVTEVVNEWLAGSRPNHGFVLVGNDESKHQDVGEQGWYGYYGGLALQLTTLKK